ncbi:MAG: type IA DNA topoisomerase, partial [Lachnospiraceae bacterium]|nr:type IA DNA topoisomerase [Lachnospiraceae bacterium]
MGKTLYIAEKPSVALEFARVLKVNGRRADGFVESEEAIVTWCVGHLVTMSYPEAYDPALKRWTLERIPFIPTEWKYEIIEGVKKQFGIVAGLLNRPDVDTIYVCTDSGREGEYIYRLVRQEAKVKGKREKRVFIDSQTEEEILRGVREAKDLSYYDPLASSAYLRAKEDYLMGINFSRALTLKFGRVLASSLRSEREVVSVGRVMTCVLGMVVRREREIRSFTATPFYRVLASFEKDNAAFSGEWKAVPGSRYFETPALYKENGFRKKEDAEALISELKKDPPVLFTVLKNEKKQERKKAPLLFNLAEFQNECSKRFRISPDQALNHLQELYEKKLVTYPRTDARVLSTAVAKEIQKNIGGLTRLEFSKPYAEEILAKKAYLGIEKTQYTNDQKITDHYAVIPTGQTGAYTSLSALQKSLYELIVRRFLAIFYPPAVYEKLAIETERKQEHFFSSFRIRKEEGYLKVYSSGKGDEPKEEG